MWRRLFVEVSEDTYQKVADSAQLARRSVRDEASLILERAVAKAFKHKADDNALARKKAPA